MKKAPKRNGMPVLSTISEIPYENMYKIGIEKPGILSFLSTTFELKGNLAATGKCRMWIDHIHLYKSVQQYLDELKFLGESVKYLKSGLCSYFISPDPTEGFSEDIIATLSFKEEIHSRFLTGLTHHFSSTYENVKRRIYELLGELKAAAKTLEYEVSREEFRTVGLKCDNCPSGEFEFLDVGERRQEGIYAIARCKYCGHQRLGVKTSTTYKVLLPVKETA